jgi:hypothetical protein
MTQKELKTLREHLKKAAEILSKSDAVFFCPTFSKHDLHKESHRDIVLAANALGRTGTAGTCTELRDKDIAPLVEYIHDLLETNLA